MHKINYCHSWKTARFYQMFARICLYSLNSSEIYEYVLCKSLISALLKSTEPYLSHRKVHLYISTAVATYQFTAAGWIACVGCIAVVRVDLTLS